MLRRASEIFLGAVLEKSTVKCQLSYVAAERYEDLKDGKETEKEALDDSLVFELKWCTTDKTNIDESKKRKQQALELGQKTLHTFSHVTVKFKCNEEGEGEGKGKGKGKGESPRSTPVSVSITSTTKETRLNKVTFQSLGTDALAPSLHLVLDEAEIQDINHHVCIQEAAQACFFKWLNVSVSFNNLTRLNCSYCNLTTFPASVANLGAQLRSLKMNYNKILEIPDKVMGKMVSLEELELCGNLLQSIPASISTLMNLHTLDFEDNKLTTIICPFNSLSKLRVLRLKGNSLLYLPPLVGNTTLQELSVANLYIKGNIKKHADWDHMKYEEIMTTFSETNSFLSPLKNAVAQTNRWIPFFDLFVGRSEAHPLVLAAILHAFEDKEACEYVSSQERGVLQQLVLLTLSNDVDIVQRSSQCLISAFSKCPYNVDRLLENNMQQCVCTLLGSNKVIDQEAGLRLLSHISYKSDEFSSAIFNENIMTLLISVAAEHSIDEDYETCGKALECLGNVALSLQNREKMVQNMLLLKALHSILSKTKAASKGQGQQNNNNNNNNNNHSEGGEEERSSRKKAQLAFRCAIRVLSILGLNDEVDRAKGLEGSRGVRVLSIDGGGNKGRCALQMCRVIEKKTGKKISELFDLIVGVSTGSVIAMGLGVLAREVEKVEEGYEMLTKAFRRGNAESAGQSWVEQMSGYYLSGKQNIQAVFRGCLYNHELLENYFKEFTSIPDEVDDSERFCAYSRSMINTSALNCPRVACLASLTNCARPLGYCLRNYNLAPDKNSCYKRSRSRDGSDGFHGLEGTSSFTMWQSLRASTAAPLYVEGYIHQEDDLFLQDGALTSNNPVVVAFQEASAIWPERNVDVIVSLGNGVPSHELTKPKVKTVMETMMTVVESATSVDRDHTVMDSIVAYLNNPNNADRCGCKYFRFQIDDQRCDLMLDETNEVKLRMFEEAYNEYIEKNNARFDLACRELLRGEAGEMGVNGSNSPNAKDRNENSPSAGHLQETSGGGEKQESCAEWNHSTKNIVVQIAKDSLLEGCASPSYLVDSKSLYNACLMNESYSLKILSSEQCMQSRGSCVSVAEVSTLSRHRSRSNSDWGAADNLSRCLNEAYVIHLDTFALTKKGFVARWASEPLTVMEPSFEAEELLRKMVGRFVSDMDCDAYSDANWIKSLSQVKTFEAFFKLTGTNTCYLDDSTMLVLCGRQELINQTQSNSAPHNFGSGAASTTALRGTTLPVKVTLCSFKKLEALEIFTFNERAQGKVVVISHPLVPQQVVETLLETCKPQAIVRPKLRPLDDSQHRKRDLAKTTSELMSLYYQKILFSKNARESWNWMQENYPSVQHHLSVTFSTRENETSD